MKKERIKTSQENKSFYKLMLPLFSESDIPSSLGFIFTSLTSEHVTSKVSFPKSGYCSEINWNWILTYY